MVEKGSEQLQNTSRGQSVPKFSDLHKGPGLVIAAEFTRGDQTSFDPASVERRPEIFVVNAHAFLPQSLTIPGLPSPLELVTVSVRRVDHDPEELEGTGQHDVYGDAEHAPFLEHDLEGDNSFVIFNQSPYQPHGNVPARNSFGFGGKEFRNSR